MLGALGFDTGFTDHRSAVYDNCNAGMERDLRDPAAPYVVKSPYLCDELDGILRGGEVVVDHALIPVRNLFAAAESRRDVSRRAGVQSGQEVPGGLWCTELPDQQEKALAMQLYKLIYTIATHEVPMTLLHFPRIVKEPEYLYAKLLPLLGAMPFNRFLEAFRSVARPETVHEFPAG